MKIHNWKTIIKYFMKNKQDSELWDYVTSLRGPDNDTNTWKTIITCMIRGQCTTAYDIEKTRTFLFFKNDNNISDALNKEMIFLSSHWFNHSIFALECLATYYSNEMNDFKTSSLFYELSYALNNRSTKNEKIKIVRIVREIIEELYKKE